MYHTEEQHDKIVRGLTKTEKKPRKKTQAQIFYVKPGKNKSK